MRQSDRDPSLRPEHRPNPVVAWWEKRTTPTQLMISFPVFTVLMFVINLGPFNQPLLRSVLYGLFEGGVLSGLLALATATERGRRA
jgi:hypothetical protein